MKIKEILEYTQELTVLYVEDDEDVRLQLIAILEKLFKQVEVAKDGAEGLEIYSNKKGSIDLIITDINMPKKNGIEMSLEIKELNHQVHIIVVTAHGDVGYFSKAIEIGVDGFIIKPINKEQLFETIHKVAKNILLEKSVERYQNHLEELVEEKTKTIEKLYTYDTLTGCLTRKKMEKELDNGKVHTLSLINIDNFDIINSTYGYRIGDGFLREFAQFLSENISDDKTLYRVGGDEFALIGEDDCAEKCEELFADLNQKIANKTFSFNEISLQITFTAGIVVGDDDILLKAHAAIKDIREIGKNRYHLYSDNSHFIAKQKNNIVWMKKVKEALKNDMVTPFFQPIVDNKTEQIIKYECLARITSLNEVIAPYYFIEPARLVGLLPNITKVMIEKSFAYFSDKDVGFTVNITEDDLKAGFLMELVRENAAKYGVKPERVTLEILENISASGTQEELSQIEQLKNDGYKIALDDFGSENSNLNRLQKLRVDIIKIDGSFIKDLDTSSNSEKIVRTIVHLAKSLEAETIAEFVHSKEVFEKVQELGIDYSQGYYFSEPKKEI